jgi:hypothetical protein
LPILKVKERNGREKGDEREKEKERERERERNFLVPSTLCLGSPTKISRNLVSNKVTKVNINILFS